MLGNLNFGCFAISIEKFLQKLSVIQKISVILSQILPEKIILYG